MQIFSLDGVERPDGSPAHIGVIGSCRVHGPIRALAAAGGANRVAFPFNAYTHTPREALQYLRYAQGQLPVPLPLEPYVFGKTPMRYPTETFADLIAGIDLMIVEIASLCQLSVSGLTLQQNYFVTNFIREGGRPYLDWWRSVLREDGNRDALLDQMIREGQADAPWRQELMQGVSVSRLDRATLLADTQALVAAHPARFLFVTHFQPPEQAPIPERSTSISLVNAIADETGSGCFDPSSIVAEAGRVHALKAEGKDLYHYADAFEPVIGRALADAAAEQLAQPAPKRAVEPGATYFLVPDRPLLEGGDVAAIEQAADALSARAPGMADLYRRHVLDLDPSRHDLALNCARQALKDGQWQSALYFARRAADHEDLGNEAAVIEQRCLSALGVADPLAEFEALLSARDTDALAAFCKDLASRPVLKPDIADRWTEARSDAEKSWRLAVESGDVVTEIGQLELLMALDPEGATEWRRKRQARRDGLVVNLRRAVGDRDDERIRDLSDQLITLRAYADEAHHLRGRLLAGQGAHDEAEAHFLAAITLDPARAAYHLDHARSLLAQDRVVAAAEAFLTAHGLARAAGDAGIVESAALSVQRLRPRLIERVSDTVKEAANGQGLLTAWSQIDLARRAAGSDADCGLLLDALAESVRVNGLQQFTLTSASDHAARAEAAEVCLAIEPDSLPVLDWLAHYRLNNADAAGALPLWERLTELQSNQAENFLGLARCHDRMGMTGAMHQAAATCLTLMPDSVEARALLDRPAAGEAELE